MTVWTLEPCRLLYNSARVQVVIICYIIRSYHVLCQFELPGNKWILLLLFYYVPFQTKSYKV